MSKLLITHYLRSKNFGVQIVLRVLRYTPVPAINGDRIWMAMLDRKVPCVDSGTD